jgi:hypothetical protein
MNYFVGHGHSEKFIIHALFYKPFCDSYEFYFHLLPPIGHVYIYIFEKDRNIQNKNNIIKQSKQWFLKLTQIHHG